MHERLYFAIYCIEEYKFAKGMRGDEVVDLFNKYSIIEYIEEFYEVLTLMGPQGIIDDIDEEIKIAKSKNKKHKKAIK